MRCNAYVGKAAFYGKTAIYTMDDFRYVCGNKLPTWLLIISRRKTEWSSLYLGSSGKTKKKDPEVMMQQCIQDTHVGNCRPQEGALVEPTRLFCSYI